MKNEIIININEVLTVKALYEKYIEDCKALNINCRDIGYLASSKAFREVKIGNNERFIVEVDFVSYLNVRKERAKSIFVLGGFVLS